MERSLYLDITELPGEGQTYISVETSVSQTKNTMQSVYSQDGIHGKNTINLRSPVSDEQNKTIFTYSYRMNCLMIGALKYIYGCMYAKVDRVNMCTTGKEG